MNTERHRRAKEVFLVALRLPRSGRAGYLGEVCAGDTELAREVERMLDFDDAETGDFEAFFDLGPDLEAEPPLAAGDLVAGRYRVRALLGRGGMGEVYLARDETLDEDVALKFPARGGEPSGERIARHLEEARSARAVAHPGVCRVHDVGEADGRPFISMEYLAGEDLATHLRDHGPLAPERAVELAVGFLDALAAIHAEGLLHRDLKPANIVLDAAGRPHVADFGVALQRGGSSQGSPRTPGYVAPEVLAGEPPTSASDLFSAGVVLYEAVTGRRAFPAATDPQRASEQDETPPMPSELGLAVDPVLEHVIQRCLDSDPLTRPSDAAALRDALSTMDPLEAVLALGQAPSPRVLAASRSTRGFLCLARRRLLGLAVLLAIFVLALCETARLPATSTAAPQEPEALARRQRERLGAALGGQLPEGEIASGIERREPGAEGPGPRVRGLRAGALLSWYRIEPGGVTPWSGFALFGGARAGPEDPPWGRPGSLQAVFDDAGRLALLRHAPLSVEAGDPSWRALFELARLSLADFHEVTPELPLESAALERRAWRDRAGTLRVEAGNVGGRVSHFVVLEEGAPVAAGDGSGEDEAVVRYLFSIVPLLFLASALLAWRNLRSGRGDPVGATRLAQAVLATTWLSWLLGASHARDPTLETMLVIAGLSVALTYAAASWCFYLAIESLVKRWWPRALITWTQLLRGAWRGPLVRSHVLLGIAAGVGFAALRLLESRALDSPEEAAFALQVRAAHMHPWPRLASTLLQMPVLALQVAFFLVVALTLLRTTLRREWAAAALALGLFLVTDLLESGNWRVTVPLMGAHALGAYLVFRRIGFLPLVVALGVQLVLTETPLTLRAQDWYVPQSTAALAVVAALVAYAASPYRPKVEERGFVAASGENERV